MKPRPQILSGVWAGLAALALILDSRCAAESAREALELCLYTLIPNLFPLFVVVGCFLPVLGGFRMPWLAELLRIPAGSEGIFLMGAVGGFPMGGACIARCVESGSLSQKDGARMLGFCNNCGPAFLFGVLGGILGGPRTAVAVYVIELEAAVLTAMLWPGTPGTPVRLSDSAVSVSRAVQQAGHSMAGVCSWVILAKVLAGFLERWLFPLLPSGMGPVLSGMLELTTGCLGLKTSDPAAGFVLGCIYVCFGGFCVHLQIHGLTGFGLWMCLGQKMVQAMVGGALAVGYLRFGWMFAGIVPGWILTKKAVEIFRRVLYNSPTEGGITNAVSKKDGQGLPLLCPQHQAE